jgi:AcrR family transcriptional regulator
LTAALEVFSKSSFGDATTEKIARRARVSKRDIYAAFPHKHAILAAVINTVLETDGENFTRVVTDSREAANLQERLEIIGLALISEILSPVTGFISRLISSEIVNQPPIGAIYFENWYNRRSQLISQVLFKHLAARKGKSRRLHDADQASKHFVALITHLPQLTVGVGMREIWNAKSVQAHVKCAVERFLKAYPSFN